LREAIRAANQGSTIDSCVTSDTVNTLQLQAGTYRIKPKALGSMSVTRGITQAGFGYKKTVIELDPAEASGGTPSLFDVQSGSLDVQDLTIRNFRSRVLTILPGASATLRHARLRDNHHNFFDAGSCILNQGIVTITDSEIANCDGTSGGALRNAGSATIRYSSFVGNSGERGGAIFNAVGASLLISSSTLGNNRASAYGGAIQNSGSATIESSTIAYNRTDVDAFETCRSFATQCSAIQHLGGSMVISGSVVAHNTARTGQTEPNCLGMPLSDGGNLLGELTSTACEVVTRSSAVPNVSPQNPSLSNGGGDPLWYGGVGRTYMPTTNSVLLNKIPSSTALCTLNRDQRRINRSRANCDIGSVERSPALFVVGNLTLSSGDSVIKFALENLGYAVTTQHAAETTSGWANGMSLVVISDSVTSTQVNAKFRDVPVGALVLESAVFDDMRMTDVTLGTHYGTASDFGVILEPGFIASRFGSRGFTTTSSSSVVHAWGIPGPQASRLAYLNSSSSRFSIFAYGPGAQLIPSTSRAAGYRVGFFATDALAGNLTGDAVVLLQEAMLLASQ
ncbi:MAG TPA: right-handed parallel beta-helix repeat-containing protein, partial [Polyangiaceae bacterium]|nr:right-handed parallel beta-helix repeat-containing protein [Polyangiaceae bacterium]